VSGIPSWARRGAKVVCVDAEWGKDSLQRYLGLAPTLIADAVYTVTRAEVDGGEATVWLREAANDLPDGVDSGFWLVRFRPLVEPKTEAEDREFFRHWLKAPHSSATTPAPVEGADA
jgi:hypothetical protein